MISYEIYDTNGTCIEEGILSSNENSRLNFSSVTLASGHTAVFRNSGYAFVKESGDSMKFTYTLNTSATVVCRIMKTSTLTGSGSTWSTTTKTASSGTVTKTADADAYYYPKLTNNSSSSIIVSSASFN